MSTQAKTFDAILAELAKPFDPAAVEFKPGAVAKNEARALALGYVDSRDYMCRLDAADPTWSDAYEVLEGSTVVCRLTVGGVTRCDLGRKDEAENNSLCAAAAQAFKRACVKFGLGRYLYALPQAWVEYDPQRKHFTPAALATLRATLAQPAKLANPEDGNGRHPQPPRNAGNGSGEVKPEPQNGNGKPATIKTPKWAAAAKALTEHCPYYAKDNGQPDWSRLTETAASCGFADINDANLDALLTALSEKAAQGK